MSNFFFFLKSKLINKYVLYIGILLFGANTLYSQELYIFTYNGIKSAEECHCNYFAMSIQSYGKEIYPISVNGDIYIFDKKPTFFSIQAVRPDSYMCSGFCGDGLEINYSESYTGDCTGSGLMSNQVLTLPTNTTNSFCDKVTLTAKGCTGTQRFFWEYSTDGNHYKETKVSTGVNENYVFVKSNYLPDNYSGNIYFRTLIDSDPYTTAENIYSNVANYKVTSCSPLLDGLPITAKVKCNNESNGSVTLKFKTGITDTQKLLLNLYEGSVFKYHKFASSTDIANKTFTWNGLPQGTYTIKYQAQNNSDSNTQVGSLPVISPSFTIENVQPLTFTTTAVQPACSTDKGAVLITASGGTPPYYYMLDNETLANKHPFTSPYTIPDLSDGGHKVIVVDSNNCIEK